MTPEISRDEWLRALDEAVCANVETDASALTVGEFAAMCGIPYSTAGNRLELMVKNGKAVRTKKRSAGRVVMVKAYRLASRKCKR
jgi:hypothetical protein